VVVKHLNGHGYIITSYLTDKILDLALEGPVDDLEDNIQLHSASEAECDVFLTNDKRLLGIKFFGKTKTTSPCFDFKRRSMSIGALSLTLA